MAVLMFLADLACFYVRAVDHSVICTGRPDAPAAHTLISMPQSGCGDVGKNSVWSERGVVRLQASHSASEALTFSLLPPEGLHVRSELCSPVSLRSVSDPWRGWVTE